jgi:outer membrane protein insertion porin family
MVLCWTLAAGGTAAAAPARSELPSEPAKATATASAPFTPGAPAMVMSPSLDDDTLADRPISSVVLRGLARVNETEIRNNLRVAPGQPYESRAAKDDVATLYRLGHFASVSADALLMQDGTVQVTYTFVEQPIIRDIQFVGNKSISDQELKGTIGLYAGGPRDDFLLERAVQRIRDAFRGRGHYLVDVNVDETRLLDTGILIFRIVEGPRVRIMEIEFTGISAFTAKQLGAQIKTKPWAFLFQKGNLDEETLVDDVATLDRFYKDRGFVDVRVDKRIDISPDGKEAKVVFVIDEGRQYRLRTIYVDGAGGGRGASTVMNAEQMLGLMVIRPGDDFTQKKVDDSLKAVKGAYETMGYVDARVNSTWVRIGESPEIDMLVTVNEGAPYTAGLVRIQGNPITRDNVIRRQIRIQPGRPLDGRELEFAKRRIQGTGLFADVRITPQRPDASDPSVRDVLVEVKERNTGSFNFGLGAGTDSGLFGNISLTQSNFDIGDWPQSFEEFAAGRAFRGAGQTFNISVSPGIDVSTYSVSFSDPRFLESDYGFSTSAFYRNRVFQGFTEERLAANVGVSRAFGDLWSGALRVNAQRVLLDGLAAGTPLIVWEQRGPDFIDSASFTMVRSTLDNAARPTRGSRVEATATYYGAFGGDYQYPMVQGEYTTFLALDEDFFGRKSVLRLNVNSGYIFSDTAPVFERFYLGGNSFRGFAFRAISPLSPEAITDNPPNTFPTVNSEGQPNGDPIGGQFMFFAGAQYEIPIFDELVSGVVFCDSGTVTDDVTFDQYRVSVGIGLRLYVPQLGPFPIAFDFAVPVKKQDTDQTQTFSFSAALPF